jgi:hypothetical protein
MLNVTVEDGTIKPRNGFRKVVNTINNFNNEQHGFDYVQGFNTTTKALVEEYLSFEKGLSQTRAFTTNPVSLGTKTEIKNGTTVVTLDPSRWKAFGWQDVAYLYNANNTNPIYRHKIGDATSMDVVNPAQAPGALSYEIVYGGGSHPYTFIDYTGLNMSTGVAYTGLAQASGSINNGTSIGIAHNINGGQQTVLPSSWEVDFTASTAGARDHSHNDVFLITITGPANSPIRLNTATVQFTFLAEDGTTSLTPTTTLLGEGQSYNYQNSTFRIQFDNKDRNLWNGVRKLRMNYSLSARSLTNVNLNVLTIQTYIGGVMIPQVPDLYNSVFYGTYYDSAAHFESDVSPPLVINNSILYGSNPMGQYTNFQGLGTWLSITMPSTSDPGVDHYHFYEDAVNQGVTTYYLIGDETTTTHVHKETYSWVLTQDTFTPAPFSLIKPIAASPYKGWVVYGTAGGYQNVCHSRVGDPEKFASENDDAADDNRGATFSLADDVDDPLNIHPCGDVLVITGSRGIYAQSGDTPSSMTPPRKIPDSKGSAGPDASCQWRDQEDYPGIVFVDPRGEVWMVVLNQSYYYRPDQITEISGSIRGALATFLRDGQSYTDFSTVQVFVDEHSDSLWIVMGHRAAVLRRPSKFDDQRHWEFYDYNMPSSGIINYTNFSERHGIKWLRSTGETDEAEVNSSTGAYITGSNRDDGHAIASLYYTSKIRADANRRLDGCYVKRDTLTDPTVVTAISTRQTASLTIPSGKEHVRFNAHQQGREHQIKLTLTETHSPIRMVEVEELGPLSRRVLQ